MDLRNILTAGILGLSLACSPKTDMTELNIDIPQSQFVKKAIDIVDSTKEARLKEGTAFGGRGMTAIYQVDSKINNIPFRLIRGEHVEDRFSGTDVCIRPLNSKGFYLKINNGSHSLNADYSYITDRSNEIDSREYAQKFCEGLEASYGILSDSIAYSKKK